MNTIQTLERYNDSLLARYRHGDCDVISYDDIKILIDDKNISEEIVSMMLECESKEDSEYIFNRIFNKTKENKMNTTQNTRIANHSRRVEIKDEIKSLRVEHKDLVISALNDYNQAVNEDDVKNINFASNKAKNEFMLRCKLDTKDTLVLTVCQYKIYNLTIQFNQSESALKDALKYYLCGLMSKSSFKSEDKFTDAKKDAKEKYNATTKEARKTAKDTFIAGLK